MQGKDIKNSTINQLFKPIFSKSYQESLKSLDADKYVNKLFADKLIMLMAFAQINQLSGLRAISNSLNDEELKEILKLDSISHSQISRSLADLNTDVLQILFKALSIEIAKDLGINALNQHLGNIHLIDSSTISLCLSQHRWAEFRKTKGGIKLHLRLNFYGNGVLPSKAIVTPAKPADKNQMDSLVVHEEGALNVFDRAYVDYRKFDDYCENNIRFVTRLKKNAIKEVVEELPVEPNSSIIRHQIVYLGGPNSYKTKNELHLIEVVDTGGNIITILTNDFTLAPEEISDIYRNRWQIELFFKWIKQHLKVKHFYGKSEQAIHNQIFIALITYCLMKLFELKIGYNGPLLTIKRLLQTCLYEPFAQFVKKLYRKPTRFSKGRRRLPDHEAIYQETVRQVIANEADHLDDLTYDPVIL